MLSFRAVEVVLVATIHQAKVVLLTNSIQVKRTQEAVKAERARQKIAAGQKQLVKI